MSIFNFVFESICFILQPPWPECDNNFAVMFKVGEGESPAIPDTLSEEGKVFLKLCFTFDPRDRPSASELQDHPFVKVRSGFHS